MRALIRAAGLPPPDVNTRVGRWEVDFFWPEHGLVVEIDGYGAHSSPSAFERDRIKTAELEDAGLTVRRVSDRQLDRDPSAVARRLFRDLGLRS